MRSIKMNGDITKQHWGTLVIGAGQAGLATGYYLSRLKEDFLILDAGSRVGDSWRRRWDSLRLFTPAQLDGLPGLAFPAPRWSYPTKDQLADYLEGYAARFELPIAFNTQVTGLEKTEGGYELATTSGRLEAEHVVVATGTNPVAHVPVFAGELDKGIAQVHSSQYRNPASLPMGDALVVGSGVSGVEIALELAASRHTLISGHPTPHIPDPAFRYGGGLFWWLIGHVLTTQTPMGRKARKGILKGGGPLIGVSVGDLDAAGVERVPRVVGVKDGQPQLQDGRVVPVAAVVWATGFRPDFSWIHLDVTDETGWPKTNRGVCENAEGLYFVGMLFQYSVASGLVGGVGRDAAFVVNHLHAARQ
jgi:putative flavoprotein involved in K+ transport